MNHNFPSAMTSPTKPPQSIPVVGYRFHPTDDELVDHFLKRKMLGHDNDEPPISEIKVCDFEPWDIPALVNIISEDQVWYFFCIRDYKYLRSLRSNRRTKAGYWKPTGKPRKVKAKRTKEEIGTKRSLVFYMKDHPKPRRTKWIMHEYECISNSALAAHGNFLLCKLKSKLDEKIEKDEPSHMTLAPDLENQNLNEMAANSFSEEYEQSIHSAIDFENDNLTAMSTYDKGEQNCIVEVTTDSAGDEGESRYNLGSQLEIKIPNEVTAKSTCETMDFDFQNPNQKMDISETAEEGKLWSAASIPSGKTDMSTSSIAADLENNAAEATVSEVKDHIDAFFNELEAFLELEDNLNSALFSPISTDQSLSYARFETSVITGQLEYVNKTIPLCP